MPLRVYATNGLVSAGLSLLLEAALGHPLGWLWSIILGVVVGVPLTWSYHRRSAQARRRESVRG